MKRNNKIILIREMTKRIKNKALVAQIMADIEGFDLKTWNDPVERRFAQINTTKGFPF